MAILTCEWLDERTGRGKIGIAFCATGHVMLFACFAFQLNSQATRPKQLTSSLHYEHSTTAPASMVPPLLHTLFASQLQAEMNWTGGQLRRHSARQGILSKNQKQNFAKSRQQANNRMSRQPSTFRLVPDPNNGGDDRLNDDTTCRDGQMMGKEAQNQSDLLYTVHCRWPRPTLYPSPIRPLPLESLR
jgi:hypothetical protein